MKKIKLHDTDFHPHLWARMNQRGIAKEEIEKALNEGWEADDAKSGTSGRVHVFSYNNHWENKYFEEKEVRVYYKLIKGELMLLTVMARYGKNFPRKGE